MRIIAVISVAARAGCADPKSIRTITGEADGGTRLRHPPLALSSLTASSYSLV